MRLAIWLHANHAVPKIEDGGYPAWKPPELLLGIPGTPCGPDGGVQAVLAGMRPDVSSDIQN